ncbi:hypothetical protein ACI65C_009696 [Semiaphis heraclei]
MDPAQSPTKFSTTIMRLLFGLLIILLAVHLSIQEDDLPTLEQCYANCSVNCASDPNYESRWMRCRRREGSEITGIWYCDCANL